MQQKILLVLIGGLLGLGMLSLAGCDLDNDGYGYGYPGYYNSAPASAPYYGYSAPVYPAPNPYGYWGHERHEEAEEAEEEHEEHERREHERPYWHRDWD